MDPTFAPPLLSESPKPPPGPKPLKVMISSTVHGGAESTLKQAEILMRGYGYHVLCSAAGSVLVNPNLTTVANCLNAVDSCDMFVGLIRPLYGTGKDSATDRSITHMELDRAIALGKMRWILAHSTVVRFRLLVRKMFYDDAGTRNDVTFPAIKGAFDDERVIEMYEAATAVRSGVPWSERTHNWVQEFHHEYEVLDYLTKQFSDIDRVRSYFETGGA